MIDPGTIGYWMFVVGSAVTVAAEFLSIRHARRR